MRICQTIVLVILFTASLSAHTRDGPLLAAASSLRSLWPKLIESYVSDTAGSEPKASFGSSGLLSTQIINGAPFELFLSADVASIVRLPNQLLAAKPQVFAFGELHLVVPADSPLARTLSMQELAAALTAADKQNSLRLAIPNPAHAPYGRAAREALQAAGIWPLPANRLLSAENAAQTLQFVNTGAVSAAIVPTALVHQYKEGIVSIPVPTDTYQAVQHTVALLHGAGDSAQKFHDWLLGDGAQHVLVEAGLKSPWTE